jgi:hypothetical protein
MSQNLQRDLLLTAPSNEHKGPSQMSDSKEKVMSDKDIKQDGHVWRVINQEVRDEQSEVGYFHSLCRTPLSGRAWHHQNESETHIESDSAQVRHASGRVQRGVKPLRALRALPLLGLLLVLAGSARGDVVYGNYSPGNGHASTFEKVLNDFPAQYTEIGVPFQVPPGYDYKFDGIEVTGYQPSPSGTAFEFVKVRIYEGPNSNGPLDPLWQQLTTYTFNKLQKTTPGLVNGTNNGPPVLLHAGIQYWLIMQSAGNPGVYVAETRWMHNNAGVTGTILRLNVNTGINNYIATPNSVLPVFRILGTPVTPQPINPSYSSYTAPTGGGLATVYLEVVCPGAPNTNPFTMPVSVSIPANQTSAQVCQLLANAINTGNTCWGAGCPPTAPYGFQADCSGSVLRVRNSTVGLCPGAFVCADHADVLTKYSAKKQLDGVSGAIAMEIRGVTTGVTRDSTVTNIVNVTRTVRCGPDSPSQVFQGQVMLAPGMEAFQIIRSLLAALSSQGDSGVFIQGNKLVFMPPCDQGNYDIAFQANDAGIDYAFSPPFAYSFFDYVAQFTATCIPPPSDMVAWWPMDETSNATSFQDIIGGNNATPFNSPVGSAQGPQPVPGQVAGAMHFPKFGNGLSGSRVSPQGALVNIGAADFTIDAWVQVPPAPANRLHYIVNRFDTTQNKGYALYVISPGVVGNERLEFKWGDGTNVSTVQTISPLTTGQWHQVAVTFARNVGGSALDIRLYVDGVQQGQQTGNPPGLGSLVNFVFLEIGWQPGTIDEPITIDELEIFNRVLLQSEIQSIVNAGSGGKCRQPCPAITINPAALVHQTWGANVAYPPLNLTATGGTGPYTFAVSGTLPPGMVLDPDGTLHGTPVTPGTYTFAVTVTDAKGCMGARSYQLVIGDVPVDTTCIRVQVFEPHFPNPPHGPPATNSHVVATGVSYSGSSQAFTDSNGFACLIVKRNSQVSLQAFDNQVSNHVSVPIVVTTPNIASGAADCGNVARCPLVQQIDLDIIVRFTFTRGMNEFCMWGGGGPFNSPTPVNNLDSPFLTGNTGGVRYGAIGLCYGRILSANDKVAFKYTFNATPVGVISYPDVDPNNFVNTRRNVFGAGLSPIGFQLYFRPQSRVKPFVNTSGGFIFFKHPVPRLNGAQFNFTFDFGGGVQVFRDSRRAFTFGYKYQHVSNGGRALNNPGFDGHVFYFGYSIFQRPKNRAEP